MSVFPILVNHDQNRVIGQLRAEGDALFFVFNKDVNITEEGLFLIFGNAGIRVNEVEEVGNMRIIRAGQIIEFSL